MTLRTRWTNWRAKTRLSRLKREHGRVAKEAKEKHDGGLLEEWEGANEWEFEMIDATIKGNLSRDVLAQARELYLPTPTFNDKTRWVPEEEFIHTGAQWWVLTPEAMAELNGAIRREKQARREIVDWWVKVIGGFVTILTGLIGAAIGLVAVLRK